MINLSFRSSKSKSNALKKINRKTKMILILVDVSFYYCHFKLELIIIIMQLAAEAFQKGDIPTALSLYTSIIDDN